MKGISLKFKKKKKKRFSFCVALRLHDVYDNISIQLLFFCFLKIRCFPKHLLFDFKVQNESIVSNFYRQYQERKEEIFRKFINKFLCLILYD